MFFNDTTQLSGDRAYVAPETYPVEMTCIQNLMLPSSGTTESYDEDGNEYIIF